jgi:hypothetical protein
LVVLSLAAVLVAAQEAPVPTASAVAGGVQGDVNCSGVADSIDSLQILRSVAGLSTTAPCLADTGDVNCDDAVNSIDALRILRFVASLSNSTPDGCTPIGDPLGGGPSSEDLIDAALAAHEIDAETALVYTAFAAFGDSRLPPEYDGDDSGVRDSLILKRIAAAFDGLSPETQATVAPFMLPPSAPGSWLGLPTVTAGAALVAETITWQSFTAAGGKVKVWAQDRYPGDAAKAQGIADAMTGTIYPSLTGLMQREPIRDAGLPNNGGDGALDIYLVHMENNGEAPSYGDPCAAGPGYIIVDSRQPLGSATIPGLLQTAAHEFFHLIQSAYDLQACWDPEYRWATEGFATWAEDYVYPQSQSEQSFALTLLDDPGTALDASEGSHAYGTYLLPYYLSRKAGNPALIRQIWEAFEADANSVHAVGAAIAGIGGWDAVWPQVALYNWNQAPVDDYKTADGLAAGAWPEGGVIDLAGGGMTLNGVINHLSARYHHFRFPDGVGNVQFKGNNLGPLPHIQVQALKKIGGAWQPPEDWTDDQSHSFCRNLPEQHIEELVIIISNSDGDTEQDVDAVGSWPIVVAEDAECTALVATATAEINHIGRIYSTQVSGLRFTLNPVQEPSGRYRFYTLTGSPAITWHASGIDNNGCSVTGEMNISPANGTIEDGRAYGSMEVDFQEHDYNAHVEGVNWGDNVTITCPGSAPFEMQFPPDSILQTGWPNPTFQDLVLDGEYTSSTAFTTRHWTWHFEPAP